MSNQSIIAWQAPEFRHYEKNIGWYVTLGAIAVLIVGFFVIQSDVFAAVTTAIIALLIMVFARQKPALVEIELGIQGIKFGNVAFPYKQIKYFWVVHDQHHKSVIFHTTALMNNVIILELENQDPEAVRQYLLQHLQEHESSEATPVQKIMHKLKF